MSSLWKEVAIGILKIKPMTPDWPEKLELRDLPKLQFQQLGEDWVRDKPNHKAFDLMLRIAISDPPDLDCETKSTAPVTGVFKDQTGSTLVHDVRFLTQHIRANDFAAWLIRKEITPSKYIQNWFKAVGVNTQPAPAPTEPSELPDLSLLAPPDQLVAVFGRHTGMDASWFDKLGDKPQLMKARKVAGQGGRGHTRVPFYCPFEVMRWLIDPKRKKGRPMTATTGWRLFKADFPKVYAIHAELDPNADSTG